MGKRFYRIRTLNRIVGDKKKELDKQEIFFQEPEKLNDPMEGFIDFVFKGDKTIWKNFFKHYILCFEWLFQNYIIFGENEIKLEIKHIPIFKSYDELETLEYKQLINNITKDCFSIYGKLIDKISIRTTPITKDELHTYLQVFHFGLYETIQRVYESDGLMKVREEIKDIDKDMINNTIESIENIEKLIEEHGVEKANRLYQSKKSWYDTMIFKIYCNTKTNTPNMNFILNFYSYYLEAVKRITFPKNYVASFLDNPHNSSVWGNYGENHTGICLIFESNENEQLTFLNSKIGEGSKGAILEKQSLKFERIDYKEEYEEVNFFESFGLLNESKIISTWYIGESETDDSPLLDKVFGNIEKWRSKHWKKYHKNKLIKTKDWEYENEYRITYNNLQEYEVEDKYRKLKYDFNSLKGIIFGIKTPMEEKCKIIEIIKKKCEKNNRVNFEFYQAYYCEVNKNIQSRDLNIKFNNEADLK